MMSINLQCSTYTCLISYNDSSLSMNIMGRDFLIGPHSKVVPHNMSYSCPPLHICSLFLGNVFSFVLVRLFPPFSLFFPIPVDKLVQIQGGGTCTKMLLLGNAGDGCFENSVLPRATFAAGFA